MTPADPALAPPRCEVHDRSIDTLCPYCGDFQCESCMTLVEGQLYCRSCVERGRGQDYLAIYRAKLWGKRDGWAWLIGIGAIFNVVVTLSLIVLVATGRATGGLGPGATAELFGIVGLQAFFALVGLLFFAGRARQKGAR